MKSNRTKQAAKPEAAPIDWSTYLAEIIEKPGILAAAYSAFHNYSIGNQMLAVAQCMNRGIVPGPLASFNAWKEKGRSVRKGEKAIELCMPVILKSKDDGENMKRIFVIRRNWFVLQQTDGADFVPTTAPTSWNKDQALRALNIEDAPFSIPKGNCQGYASGRGIAINPLAMYPQKTTFHELAHVVLGHTAEGVEMNDGELTPQDIREVEAESTAYILCNVLALPGLESSRAYVQSWLGDHKEINSKSAQRIFSAADKILRAGLPSASDDKQERSN